MIELPKPIAELALGLDQRCARYVPNHRLCIVFWFARWLLHRDPLFLLLVWNDLKNFVVHEIVHFTFQLDEEPLLSTLRCEAFIYLMGNLLDADLTRPTLVKELYQV